MGEAALKSKSLYKATFLAIYMYIKRDKKPSCGWNKK
jgi:hypothetical protein